MKVIGIHDQVWLVLQDRKTGQARARRTCLHSAIASFKAVVETGIAGISADVVYEDGLFFASFSLVWTDMIVGL